MTEEEYIVPANMRDVLRPQITDGISRNMNLPPTPLAGGDKNGSANTAHLMGQAGTGCAKIDLPRTSLRFNYCGTV